MNSYGCLYWENDNSHGIIQKNLSSIKQLKLDIRQPSETSLRRLIPILKFTHLEELDLSNNFLKSDMVPDLCSYFSSCLLKKLNIKNTNIDDKQMSKILTSLQDSDLEYLFIGHESLVFSCVLISSLKNFFRRVSLKTFFICSTNLNENEHFEELCEIFQKSNISLLSLSQCSLKSREIGILTHYLKENTSITDLNLMFNPIEDQGAEFIADMLMFNSSITRVTTWNSTIGDLGIQKLSEMLKVNTTLKSLGLNEIPNLTDTGAQYLISSLNENCVLENLNPWGCRLSNDLYQSINFLTSKEGLAERKLNIKRKNVGKLTKPAFKK